MELDCHGCDLLERSYRQRCTGNAIDLPIQFVFLIKLDGTKLICEERVPHFPTSALAKCQDFDLYYRVVGHDNTTSDGFRFANLFYDPNCSVSR